MELILYFADWQAQHTVPETRKTERVGDELTAEVVVREIIAGPEDPHLNRTLPSDTRIISVEIVDKVAYVNLSEEVTAVQGSAGETMAIDSLVYSLTELTNIEQVQILIAGEKEESLSGHMALDEPMTRGPIVTHPIFPDEERAEWLQQRVDDGEETFRTDPVEVARFDGRMLGFEASDQFSEKNIDTDNGEAFVTVERNGEKYLLELFQPAATGDEGIWMISSIEKQ